MTEMKPKCAVLMAVYNGMLYMEEQIQTILAQEDVDITLFVSVDQSSDNSEAWIDERAEEDKRIVVLPHGRRFGGAGRHFFRLVRETNFSDYD